MCTRLIAGAALTALCVAVTWEIFSPPTPRLIYNKSESAPVGWYALDPNGAVVRDVKVAAFAPAKARKLAHNRHYLPQHIPLIKTVWAVAGEKICSTKGVVSAPNRPDIHAHLQDGLGREMPNWHGCITLEKHEVFLVSIDVQTSFDSRYFGPVPLDNVLGTVRYLGLKPDDLAASGIAHGRARGMSEANGAEGKIKGGVTPWGLTPCLHIFFRGAPCVGGVTPFLGLGSVTIKVSGGAPLQNPLFYWNWR